MRRTGILGIGSMSILAGAMAVVASNNFDGYRSADVRNKHGRVLETGNRLYLCSAIDRNKYDRPHCGARQQARYTRQLAAGQISFITHGPRTA